jgi:hypothetical protein
MASRTARNVSVRLSVEEQAQATESLRKFGKEGSDALKQVEAGAVPASAGLKAVDAASRELQASLGGVAAAAGPLGRILTGLGPIGIATAVATGGIAIALGKVTQAGLENERQMNTIRGVLNATGHASGLTAKQIDELTDALARQSLATSEETKKAAAALLTFRQVSGDSFGRTLTLATDLAAVMGQDVASAAVQLGKALEDPERNLSQLNRSGISFSQTQIELIKGFKETGQEARAISLILDTIEGQVGGAGRTASGGLAGEFHRLGEATGDFLEGIAERSGVLETFARGLREVTAAVDAATKALSPESRLAAAQGELATVEAAAAGTRGTQRLGLENRARALRAEIASLIGEIERLALAEAAEMEAAQRGTAAQLARTAADHAATAAKKELAAHVRAEVSDANELIKAQEELERLAGDVVKGNEKRAASLDKYIQGLEVAARAEGASSTEKRVQLALQEAQNKLINEYGVAVRELSDEEKRRVETAVRLREETEEARKAAEKFATEVGRQVDRITDNLSRALGDTFFEELEGRSGNFWESFERLGKRALANLAAEFVVNAVFRGGLTGAVSAAPGLFGITSPGASSAALAGAASAGGGANIATLAGLSGLLSGLQSPLLGGLGAQFGGFLGLGAGGQAALGNVFLNAPAAGLGGAIAGLLGLGSGNFLQDTAGSLLGGAGGALIGASLGGVGGPVGAALGAVLGTVVSGLFGGDQSFPFGERAIASAGGRFVLGSAGTLDGGSLGGVDAIAAAIVEASNRILGTFGGTAIANDRTAASGGPALTRVTSSSGHFGIAGLTGIGGGPGLSAEAFTIAGIRNVIGFLSEGLPPSIVTAARNSVARTAEELISDLDFAASLAGLTEQVSPLEQALRQVNDRFAEMEQRAIKLGLGLDEVNAARDRELANVAAQARLPFAQAAGSLVEFVRAQHLASLSPAARLTEAQRIFGEVVGRVQGGEIGLTGSLISAAQAVLGSGAENFGQAGSSFAALQGFVNSSLLNLAERIVSDDFMDANLAATREQTAVLADGIEGVRGEVASLRRELVVIGQRLAAA